MSSDLRELYQSVILDHSKRPRNCCKPECANRSAEGINPLCGDQLTVYLAVEDDVVGFAHGMLVDGPPPVVPRKSGFVTDLFVAEPRRRRGIGRGLAGALAGWFRELCGPDANSHTRSVTLTAKLLWRSPVSTKTGLSSSSQNRISSRRSCWTG